jgi:hypothetical protein
MLFVQLGDVIACVCPTTTSECAAEGGVCVDNCGAGKEKREKEMKMRV